MEVAMSSAVHISLNVSDLDRSVGFYRRFFGEPRKLKTDYAKFVSVEPEIHLAIQPGLKKAGASGALSHLGIRVESTEEVQKWKSALQDQGVATEEEKEEACCYAVQDKFWLSDPDGNRWEIYTVLEDVEQPKPEASACCAPECCTTEASR
jgi:catechol 2,3-dioxygenase-like lactoylglutathione lyase family enzyme